MKLSKKEVKDKIETNEEDIDRYPWGLGLHLDNDSLERLGITELPDVGDKKMIVGFIDVTETSENETSSGKKNKSIRLQITDMSIEERVKPDKLKTLYDGESKK